MFSFFISTKQLSTSRKTDLLIQPANMISSVHKRAEYVIEIYKEFVARYLVIENVENITNPAKSSDF